MGALADSQSPLSSCASTGTPQLLGQHQQHRHRPTLGHSMRTFRSNRHLLQHPEPPQPHDLSTASSFAMLRSGGCGVSEVLTDSVVDLRLRELVGDYSAGPAIYAAKHLQQQHLQHQRLLSTCADYSTKAAADLLDFSGDFTDFHSFGSDISGELEKLALTPGWGGVLGDAEVQGSAAAAPRPSGNKTGSAGSFCGRSEDGDGADEDDNIDEEDKREEEGEGEGEGEEEESPPPPATDTDPTTAAAVADTGTPPVPAPDNDNNNLNGNINLSSEMCEMLSVDSVLPVVRSSVQVLETPTSTIEDKRSAAARLRQLAKHRSDFRALIGSSSGAIAALIPLLRSSDPLAQENAATALLNLSLEDSNKDPITAAGAIKPLVYALKTGTSTAKQNAACALLNLSMFRDNEVTIGACGAIPPLVSLLLQGSSRGKKDALTTLYKLCSTCRQNKERAVRAGAVAPLLALVGEYGGPGTTEKAMVVLSCLAGIPQGSSSIVEEGGVPLLVEAIEEDGGGSVKGKEFAVLTLLQLCSESDSGPVRAMLVREGAIPPLVALSQSGSASVKHKAERLLGYLREQRHDAAAVGGGSAGS